MCAYIFRATVLCCVSVCVCWWVSSDQQRAKGKPFKRLKVMFHKIRGEKSTNFSHYTFLMNFSVAFTPSMYTTHSFKWLQTQRVIFDVFIFRFQTHLAFFTVSCNNETHFNGTNSLSPERDKSFLSNGSLLRTLHTPRRRGVLQSLTHSIDLSSNHQCLLTV